jgi:hypothetical protein
VPNEFLKDAPDYISLVLDDKESARFALHGRIAVCLPTGMTLVSDDAGHAAAGRVFEVIEVLAVDHGAYAVGQIGDDSIDWRHNGDVGKSKPLADRSAIFLVSAYTAHRLGDHNVEDSGSRRSEQSLYAVSVEHGRARGGPVVVRLDDHEVVAAGVFAADRDLVLNGPIVL